MNIKKAKQQVANTIKVYLAKDKYGQYIIPQTKQRPILLVGPPGIGKTDIVSQVAAELNIGFLSYQVTQHTRKSAIGTPVIRRKVYSNTEYDVSEYTMSEMLASVHEVMRNSNHTRGILFFDEINSPSETMDPVLAQFVHNKFSGGPKLPEGWIVVTSASFFEYADCTKEFGVISLDRFKCITVEPDFDSWKEYAGRVGINAAIMSYLTIKPQNFYKIEEKPGNEQEFVTARGWEDLSKMINAYEMFGNDVDTALVSQYLHNTNIVDDFAAYYQRCKKYKSSYNISEIYANTAPKHFRVHIITASPEERFSFLWFLLDDIFKTTMEYIRNLRVFNAVCKLFQGVKSERVTLADLIKENIEKDSEKLKKVKTANNILDENAVYYAMKLSALARYREETTHSNITAIRKRLKVDAERYKADAEKIKKMYSGLLNFCEKVYGEDSVEMGTLVTELATNIFTSSFIADYDCAEYHKYDKKDIFKEKRDALVKEIEEIHIFDEYY